MKIGLAQIQPERGNVEANIHQHLRLVELAISLNTELLLFPELSLTGYEPELAHKLATTAGDSRFQVFQNMADQSGMIIGCGIPLKTEKGIQIGLILFSPEKPRQVFTKQLLHQDEEAYFVAGENSSPLLVQQPKVALAICYELSVPAHAETAHQFGAEIYLASVAKTEAGMTQATMRLSEIASQFEIPVLMVNCIGPSGDGHCAGGTAVWNGLGLLLDRLNEQDEGVLVYDTFDGSTATSYLKVQ